MTMNPIECPQASPRSYFLDLWGRSGLLLYPTLVLLALVATACQEPPEETAAETSPGTVSVWIDTDPSVAPGGREVDDGLALIQAFHSDELDIRGVSIVFGNAPLEEAFPIGQGIVQRFGPEGLEVYSGAESRAQLGQETAASRALAEALRQEPLIVLALGPVTNVATVLGNHPELARRIPQVIAVAGRRPDQPFITGEAIGVPHQDFNFELDADAFQVILDSGVPLTLAPWELSSKVWLLPEDLDRLAAGPPGAQWLTQPARDWLTLWTERFAVDGFNPFDTLAVGFATSPHLITCELLPIVIRSLPDDRAIAAGEPEIPEKPYLLVAANIRSTSHARYCYDTTDAFKTDLMARLLRSPVAAQ